MALDRSSQPIVKDASSVLVGVAQVRIGRASIRGTDEAAKTGTELIPVGKSKKVKAASNANVLVVKPEEIYVANGLTTPPTLSTTTFAYSGKVDGNIIIRAVGTGKELLEERGGTDDAAKIQVFDTYGQVAVTSAALASQSYTVQGVVFTAAFTGAKIGDTWVIPCWASADQNMNQTGIITPFSMFKETDSSGSIGGLRSASFTPKIDGIKTLESGFPSYIADQIIDKVSVDLSWSGMEYGNANLNKLRRMISRVINTGELSAIPVEMVMRTRGGKLVRIWVPSATFSNLPTYAPTNDYSEIQYSMTALKMTEFTSVAGTGLTDVTNTGNAPTMLDTYNAWLSEAPLYTEIAAWV